MKKLFYQFARSLLILPVLLSATSVLAEVPLQGYLSAQFSMSAAEVDKALSQDQISVSSRETTDGDHLIFGKRQRSWITTDVLYVFPAETDRLALVIEVFPGLVKATALREEMVQQFGQPSGEDYPEKILQDMIDKNLIPKGVTQLTVWNLNTGGVDREARLMQMDRYVRVEYLDNDLMAGN